MNEKETSVNTVTTEQTEKNVSEQSVQELTPEEKLAERERLVTEREKALELRERTMAVSKMLLENDCPSELAEILRIDLDDEKNVETVKKAIEFFKISKDPVVAKVSTGMDHTHPSSNYSDYSDFMRGFSN